MATEQDVRRTPRRISSLTAALLVVAGSVLLLLIIFHATTPLQAGPLGILIVFALLYALFVAVFYMLLTGLAIGSRLVRPRGPRHNGRKRYYIASVLGFVPVLYLTLASMGGVSFWGVSLIFVFVALSLFYVLRRL